MALMLLKDVPVGTQFTFDGDSANTLFHIVDNENASYRADMPSAPQGIVTVEFKYCTPYQYTYEASNRNFDFSANTLPEKLNTIGDAGCVYTLYPFLKNIYDDFIYTTPWGFAYSSSRTRRTASWKFAVASLNELDYSASSYYYGDYGCHDSTTWKIYTDLNRWINIDSNWLRNISPLAVGFFANGSNATYKLVRAHVNDQPKYLCTINNTSSSMSNPTARSYTTGGINHTGYTTPCFNLDGSRLFYDTVKQRVSNKKPYKFLIRIHKD